MNKFFSFREISLEILINISSRRGHRSRIQIQICPFFVIIIIVIIIIIITFNAFLPREYFRDFLIESLERLCGVSEGKMNMKSLRRAPFNIVIKLISSSSRTNEAVLIMNDD